jgi:hypothetical protein
MKTRIQGLFTFVLVFLCAPQVTLAQELNQTFTTLEGPSMKLPVDWVRIESQLLDNSSKALGKDLPNARFQNPRRIST